MHCGMCLPACPTYQETGFERNSPRGRIALMRGVADEEIALDKDFADEMYYCLGCLACVSACPAGVEYPTLFEMARAQIEKEKIIPGAQRTFWRWLSVKTLFMHPRLLRLVGRLLYFYQASGLQRMIRNSGLLRLLPERLRELEPMTPQVKSQFSHDLIQEKETPANKRYQVLMLTGCVQDLAFSDVNRDTVDVLLANDCEVITPPVQHCCGSLHSHNGELELAKQLAIKNFEMVDLDSIDAIITNAGGCGSHLKHYANLFEDSDPLKAKARLWDRKVKDIHEWLDEIGFKKECLSTLDTSTTYHESCHLCHGQKVRKQPRSILHSLLEGDLVELAESDTCCGSAGIYNITQPEQSQKLLDKKIEAIQATGADIVTTANPGCHLQIENGLKQAGCSTTSVKHPISLLAQAYRENSK